MLEPHAPNYSSTEMFTPVLQVFHNVSIEVAAAEATAVGNLLAVAMINPSIATMQAKGFTNHTGDEVEAMILPALRHSGYHALKYVLVESKLLPACVDKRLIDSAVIFAEFYLLNIYDYYYTCLLFVVKRGLSVLLLSIPHSANLK